MTAAPPPRTRRALAPALALLLAAGLLLAACGKTGARKEASSASPGTSGREPGTTPATRATKATVLHMQMAAWHLPEARSRVAAVGLGTRLVVLGGLVKGDVSTAGVPGPDGLPVGRYDSPWFASRDVPVAAAPPVPPHARRAWFRPTRPLPDDPDLHLQSLAYLTDHGPTRAAREPHASLADDASRMSVSLDHSVWFHRPVRLDDWVLVEFVPVATGRGRGLALGAVRTREGSLLATIAQEVLLRRRAAPADAVGQPAE